MILRDEYRHNKRPRILFYAPILEYPPAGGPQMSVTNAVKALNQIAELHIVTTVPRERLAEDALDFFEKHSHSVAFLPSSRIFSENALVGRVMSRLKRVELSPLLAKWDLEFVAEYHHEHQIDIFWIDRVIEHAFSFFRLLRKHFPKALLVGDTEAVYSRFVLREVPLISNSFRRRWVNYKGKKKECEETELVHTADVVTAVSELDADYFRSIAKDKSRIKLFQNIVDLDDFSGSCETVDDGSAYVLLIGSFGHPSSPMDRAAKWLVEDIMPLVLKRVPNAKAYIVGRNADSTLSHYNSDAVRIRGRVPSMRPYLKNARASLVPLAFESGTRFKILETGAAGIPCISTTLGAEGIDVTNGKDIIIADTTEAFAEAIIKIFNEPSSAAELGANLHELIKRKYSLDVQKRDGELIVNYLLEKQN